MMCTILFKFYRINNFLKLKLKEHYDGMLNDNKIHVNIKKQTMIKKYINRERAKCFILECKEI